MEVGAISATSASVVAVARSTGTADALSGWDNSVFIRNMAALWRKDPRLAQHIDEVPDENRLELLTTRSGDVTAMVPTPGGRTLLHSRYDPTTEARRLIDSVAIDEKFCFVVSGFGLGYHVRELYDRLRGDAVIAVCEPSVEVLATALSCVDLSGAIESGRLIVLDRLDKSELHEKFRPFNTLVMLGAQFVAHPPSQQVAAKFHTDARKLITDFVGYSRMTLLTLVGNAEITCRNIAYNLPKYMSTPPIGVLRDRFRGHPAIVISGGPSLRKNVDLLAAAKGKAVLIAVQTLFKPLLERGIVPDFVTTLDFHALSGQYFNGIRDAQGVHLIAEPKVSWHVLDEYDGPVSLLYSQFAEQLIGREMAARDGLKAGATVAHLAFYLAEYMGCDPIIFVGQDLAFTGHCFYIPGVEAHRTWRSEINRFCPMETKEWERIARNRSILRKVPDVNGREVYTDELLLTYLEQFERDFESTPARVIDATEGGARMRGTDVTTLREAIDRYCNRDLPAEAFAYRHESHWKDVSRLPAVRAQIEARRREISEMDGLCDEMLGLLEKLKGLTGDAPRFNRCLVRVDELRSIVTNSYRAYRIVNSTAQLAELQRFTADRKLAAADATGAERARRQLDRDIRFVQSMRDAAHKVIQMLDRTLERFDEFMGVGRS